MEDAKYDLMVKLFSLPDDCDNLELIPVHEAEISPQEGIWRGKGTKDSPFDFVVPKSDILRGIRIEGVVKEIYLIFGGVTLFKTVNAEDLLSLHIPLATMDYSSTLRLHVIADSLPKIYARHMWLPFTTRDRLRRETSPPALIGSQSYAVKNRHDFHPIESRPMTVTG